MAVKLKEMSPESVADVVNEIGLDKAAPKLGKSKSTLVRYLKGKGYKIKRVYVREGVAL